MRQQTLKKQQPILSETLSRMLEELGDECQRILKLLSQLEMSRLTTGQVEDVLAELTASIIHLHVHTKGMDELITQELERLPG